MKSIIIGYPDNCAGNTAKTFLITSIAYAIFKTWLICNNDSKDGINFGNYDVFNSVKRNVKHYLCMYCSITKKDNVKMFLDMYIEKIIIKISIENIKYVLYNYNKILILKQIIKNFTLIDMDLKRKLY